MQRVEVCEMMGWTSQEYNAQPYSFLELLREKKRIDEHNRQQEAKAVKHPSYGRS